jgi:hypothetical protein
MTLKLTTSYLQHFYGWEPLTVARGKSTEFDQKMFGPGNQSESKSV